MNKKIALFKISQDIASCAICKKDTIGKAVVGEGNENAKVMFVGEAPGKEEAKTGRPFIGRSGKLLWQYINNIGLSEKDVYITSAVKYLPMYKTPTTKDIEHARQYLLKQIQIINPQIIVLLGAVAARSILEKGIAIKKEHGKIINKDNRTYFLTLHPAATLRFPPFQKDLQSDFKKLQKLLA